MADVWFAVPGDLSAPTGGYAYARRLIGALPAAGWQPRAIALPGGFPFPSLHELDTARQALAHVPPGMPVIVDGLAFGAMPRALLDALDCRLVALVHHPLALETGLSDATALALRACERAALAAACSVIATSSHTARTLADEYAVAADRIHVAYPGIDDAPRAAGGAGTPCLLGVGAVIPRKGFDVLVRALAALIDRPWRCLIVGSLERDAAAAAHVRALIEGHGLGRRIALAGEASAAALADAYAQADVFVLPSRHEGYGMVFAEALVRGLPIVACRSGAVPQTVPAEAGLLVPADDVDALAAALRTMLSDDEARARMAEAAWRHGRRLPRWSDTARAVATALEEAVR